MTKVTRILTAIDVGEPGAADQLLPLVYQELRRLAAKNLAAESPGQTLQPTALVHDAYLRLVGTQEASRKWNGRGHFFAAAAEAMRHILVDTARRKRAIKHGGGQRRVNLEHVAPSVAANPDAADDVDIIALDEALTRFAADEPDAAAVVKLRYFAGLTIEEAAENLGISRATASRHWTFAKAWLRKAVVGKSEP